MQPPCQATAVSAKAVRTIVVQLCTTSANRVNVIPLAPFASILLVIAALSSGCWIEDDLVDPDAASSTPDAQPTCDEQNSGGPFRIPLVGSLGEDFFYTFYVDHAPGPAVQDFACGESTYNGHSGTDIVVSNFAAMDRGVTVVAAAAGVVVETHDGEFDRNTQAGPGGFGNYVVIEHEDGINTIYGHMARDSIAVGVAEAVQAGDTLGRVGSSGNSDHPHVHFELSGAAGTQDPFSGACHCVPSQWEVQDAYDDEFRLIDSGLTADDLDLDVVKNPPEHIDAFTTSTPLVVMWVQVLDVRAGSRSVFELVDPNGASFWSWEMTHSESFPLSWWWSWHEIPGRLTQLGTWRFRYYNSGALVEEQQFTLVVGTTVLRREPAIAKTGGGGGGLRQQTRPRVIPH